MRHENARAHNTGPNKQAASSGRRDDDRETNDSRVASKTRPRIDADARTGGCAGRARRPVEGSGGQHRNPGDVLPDGGSLLPTPSDWPFAAVVHGADIDRDCLALTGAGKPCSYNAYPSNDAPVCNTHASANDPEIVPDAHQWARISDANQTTVTVCVNCKAVWHGLEPETAVDCPECEANAGERCRDETSTYAAPIPPHPTRRRRAYETVDAFEPCPANPLNPTNDAQEQLAPDGGQALRKDRERKALTDDQKAIVAKQLGYEAWAFVPEPVRNNVRAPETSSETVTGRQLAIPDGAGPGTVYLDCPECGAAGSIRAELPLECEQCGAEPDPEEVA